MRDDVIAFLKCVAEGRIPGSEWHEWIAANETYLGQVLSPGELLKLKLHPLVGAVSILEKNNVMFVASDALEWLDIDSRSGRCRFCGEKVEQLGGGGVRCPKRCFVLRT